MRISPIFGGNREPKRIQQGIAFLCLDNGYFLHGLSLMAGPPGLTILGNSGNHFGEVTILQNSILSFPLLLHFLELFAGCVFGGQKSNYCYQDRAYGTEKINELIKSHKITSLQGDSIKEEIKRQQQIIRVLNYQNKEDNKCIAVNAVQ